MYFLALVYIINIVFYTFIFHMSEEEKIENWSIKDHWYLKPDEIPEDEYYMDICRVVWEKGTCNRWRSWCVIVKDWQVVATGFVDAPEWSTKCDEDEHLMRTVIKNTWEATQHCMRNSCAELNAIAHAARQGIPLEWATIYTKMTPCYVRHCAHLIVACGIKRVVCEKRFHDAKLSEEVFDKAGVELVYLENWTEEY